MMSAAERKLASAQFFLVTMTRIVDKATFVVDDGRQLERAVMRKSGERSSVRDVAEKDWFGERADGGALSLTELAAALEVRSDAKAAAFDRQYERNRKALADSLAAKYPRLVGPDVEQNNVPQRDVPEKTMNFTI